MERYNEYKDSGVQWLGDIPSHWVDCKLRRLSKIVRGGSPRPIEDYLSDEGYNWIKIGDTIKGSKYITSTKQKIKKSGLSATRFVHSGDLILTNSMSFGNPYILDIDGCIHDGWLAFSELNGIDKEYLYYVLVSDLCGKQFKLQVDGGVVQNLNIDKVKDTWLALPPIEEQSSMVAYLDTATAKIDETIAQQQKMIDLLNERKQIIINKAVTKGLNPDVPMKDSGVDWIGEIPEHWEVMKLKHVTSKIGSGSTPRGGAEVYQDSGIMFLRSQNVYNDGLKLDDVAHIVDGVHQKMKGTQVKYNDILYNITGGSIGRCCCYDREDEANVNQHVSIVRPKGIIAKYLMYNLQSDNAQRQLRETLKGGNREGLAAVTFKEFLILTCPKEEQNQIVSHIERMFVNIDRAISNATKQISLLQERKQIITNDVVTGKVKVS